MANTETRDGVITSLAHAINRNGGQVPTEGFDKRTWNAAIEQYLHYGTINETELADVINQAEAKALQIRQQENYRPIS